MTWSLLRESRLPVGSSATMTGAPEAMARAMAARWRSPPESFSTRWEDLRPRPTKSSALSAARSLRRWPRPR